MLRRRLGVYTAKGYLVPVVRLYVQRGQLEVMTQQSWGTKPQDQHCLYARAVVFPSRVKLYTESPGSVSTAAVAL